MSYSSTGKYRWFVHFQYPDFEMGPLMKPLDTRMKKMNFLFNLFNSRLGLSPQRRVYLTLIPFPGPNNVFIENTLERTFTQDSPTPFVIALDGSKTASTGIAMGVILLILVALALILAIFMYRRKN